MEVIYIHDCWTGKVQNEVHGSYETQCSYFLSLILNSYQIESTQHQEKGIYVATSDAGKNPSIEFWSSALEYGLSYAPPRNFPWTLANSPCSYFARALKIQGPNFTLVGNGNAFIAACKHAVQDLLIEEISEAIVIGIDFSTDPGNLTQFGAILLRKGSSDISIIPVQEIASIKNSDNLKSSDIVNLIYESILFKKKFTFGNPEEGFFQVGNISNT